jgi:hypothetical protein
MADAGNRRERRQAALAIRAVADGAAFGVNGGARLRDSICGGLGGRVEHSRATGNRDGGAGGGKNCNSERSHSVAILYGIEARGPVMRT